MILHFALHTKQYYLLHRNISNVYLHVARANNVFCAKKANNQTHLEQAKDTIITETLVQMSSWLAL